MRNYSLFILILLVIAGCAREAVKTTYPTALTPEIQQAWAKAEALTSAKRYTEAQDAYQNFIELYGYNALTDKAYFKLGEILFLRAEYQKAWSNYKAAYSRVYSPTIAPPAQFKAAYSLYYLGRFKEAKDAVASIKREHASPILRARADSLAVIISKELSAEQPGAIKWQLFLLDDYTELGAQAKRLSKLKNIISLEDALSAVRTWVEDDTVSSAEVAQLPMAEYKGKKSGGYAFFKLGQSLKQEGHFKQAAKELKAYSFAYPKHEYYPQALNLLNETQEQSGLTKVKVGALLPLSGKYSVYGESVLHGIECAAGVYEPCRGTGNIQIISRDTAGDPKKVAAAVEELAALDVVAIIGPLLSATVEAAAGKAQELGVPLISLSQRDDILQIGDYIFRNTVTAQAQVETITDYAIKKNNLRRILVLYPQNHKGEEYKALLEQAVINAGGEVVGSYPYTAQRVELASEVMSLPYKLKDTPTYDAIFIPDSFSRAGYIIAELNKLGLPDVQYLGISRWYDPRLVELGGSHVEGAVFPVTFYKDAQNYEVKAFVTNFKEAYGLEPTLLEALGFDSLKVIEQILASGVEYRNSLRDVLLKNREFKGVTGPIVFGKKRDAWRKLPVLTIQNGEIVELAD